MSYRKDLYDEIGMEYPKVGNTWADFEAACKAIQGLGKKDVYGFTSIHQRGVLNSSDYMCLHHSWAPYPANQFWNPETWEPQMNSEIGYEALAYYIYLMDEYMPPGALDAGWTQCITAMQQGMAGHLIDWCAAFAPQENEEASKIVGLSGFATPPAGEKGQTASHRGTWQLTIPRDTRYPENAWDFAVFLSTRESHKKYALMGGFAPRLSLFDDPEINAKYPYTSVQKDNFDAISTARAHRPLLPEYDQLMEVVNRNLSRAEAKELTPKEALDGMAKESGDLLIEWGYWKV
jgi:multiple sugar transport system substrate-binding protein